MALFLYSGVLPVSMINKVTPIPQMSAAWVFITFLPSFPELYGGIKSLVPIIMSKNYQSIDQFPIDQSQVQNQKA